MKKNKKRIGRLCVAFSSLIIVALLATAAVFISTSAAEAVSDSDTLVSNSAVTRSDIALLSDEIPADLGEPQIVMTTSKAVGETFEFSVALGSAVYVDWGDGNIVLCTPSSPSENYISTGVVDSYVGELKSNTIKVYSNENIEGFVCSNQKLTKLDLSMCVGLRSVLLVHSNLIELDFSKCPDLVYFQSLYSDLTRLDVSNNLELETLICAYSKLTDLNISNNTKLDQLQVQYNNLEELDISKHTQLQILGCSNNNLSELDISNNMKLSVLYCNGNNISELDTSKNANLSWLICGGNDVSPLPGRGGNQLTTLDVSNNPNLEYLYCEENNLKFSTINLGDVTPENFSYKNQSTVSIASSIEAGKTIDLSSEYDIDGTKTVYKWFDSSDNEVIPTKSENGVFTFGDEFIGQTLHCTMTNALYPDLTLKTTEVEIQVNLGEPQIVMTTNKAVGDTLIFSLNVSSAYIDWGDGNAIQSDGEMLGFGCSFQGGILDNTIKIYSTTSITSLWCGGMELTSLDVSNAVDLAELFCWYNNLSELELTSNVNLRELVCLSNNLTELDVSNKKKLITLGCSDNQIKKLDISNTPELYYLTCDGNEISKLDTSQSPKLGILICGGAEGSVAEYLFYGTDSSQTSMYGGNQLTTLDVSNNPNLKYLWCEENNLKFSTINLGDTALEKFSYKNQSKVTIASSIEAGKTINLSSEYDIDGTKTVYKWFDSSDNEVIPTKSENGVFTFGDEFIGQTLYGTMTNALFPDLTLKTTEVAVEEDSLTIEDNVGIVEEATPSDGIVVRDEHGNIISLGKVKLVINHIEESKKKSIREAIEKYNTEFNADSDDCALFDISLTDKSNAKVTIEKDSGKIKIRIKYPQGLSGDKDDYKFNLYHQKSDGSIEEIAVTCEPNGIWFYADDFSPYILTWMPKSSDSTLDKDKDSTTDESDESKDPATDTSDNGNGPATGESIALTIVTSCLALLSLAAIGAVIYKKKFSVSAE